MTPAATLMATTSPPALVGVFIADRDRKLRTRVRFPSPAPTTLVSNPLTATVWKWPHVTAS